MMISLIVVDKKILSGEAMGDSLTAIPMRATGHTLNEETSTLQYSERPAETNFVGEAVFVILSRAKFEQEFRNVSWIALL